MKHKAFFFVVLLLLARRGVVTAQTSCSQTCNDANQCFEATFQDCDVTCDESGEAATLVCGSATFENSTISCIDQGCWGAEFITSTAQCLGEDFSCTSTDFSSSSSAQCSGVSSCHLTEFDQSAADCSGKDSCRTIDVLRSTVRCELGSCGATSVSDVFNPPVAAAISAFSCDSASCQDAEFFPHCTCCNGDGCPPNTPTCMEDVVSFCSTSYLERTCQDWGNPACSDVPVETQSTTNIVDCESGECVGQTFENEVVACKNALNNAEPQTCERTTFRNSSVVCLFRACELDAVFEDSTVECFANSCSKGEFNNSAVACTGGFSCRGESQFTASVVFCDGMEACDEASFVASAVTCSRGDSCTDSPTFDECSCCTGIGCPSTAPSCPEHDGAAADFCTQIVEGMTCAQRGNPLCKDVSISEPASDATGAPFESPTPAPTVAPSNARVVVPAHTDVPTATPADATTAVPNQTDSSTKSPTDGEQQPTQSLQTSWQVSPRQHPSQLKQPSPPSFQLPHRAGSPFL